MKLFSKKEEKNGNSCSGLNSYCRKAIYPEAANNLILMISDGDGFNPFESGNYYPFGEKMPELYRYERGYESSSEYCQTTAVHGFRDVSEKPFASNLISRTMGLTFFLHDDS
jgi:hypothetical protein